MPGVEIAFDVGGTFTDFVVFDRVGGSTINYKVPSTPADPSKAIETGLADLLRDHSLDPAKVSHLGHGTTVATNLVIERRGVLTGLLTTKGFRDVLEIGRQTRPHLYNYDIRRPTPLVAREHRVEIDERVLANGTVLRPIDAAEVEAAVDRLVKAGVRAIAVCFMHSYRRPDHERLAGEIIRKKYPDVFVSLSSDVLPEFREFERMSTTVLNSYMGPRMETYMDRFLSRVNDLKFVVEPNTIHSNGGLMSPDTVRSIPVRTCVSGPAAGVVGAAVIATAAGHPNIVTFDVGGTSTDVSLVKDGQPLYRTDRLVADYPVKLPMIDIHVIGAGGGSIAALDDIGSLKVGPRSAGANPGPVAYCLGGQEPTITDANLVLGRLAPDSLLGARMTVDADAARKVIEEKIAKPLGLSVEDAAFGIIQIANANMARAIRSVSTERGHDLKQFAIFAYGGAGPLHAAELARDCGIGSVLVPNEPGTLCARGILLSDVSMDFVRSVLSIANDETWGRLSAVFDEMRREGEAWLESENVPKDRRILKLALDARYQGQNFELTIPYAASGALTLADFKAKLSASHVQEYGYDVTDREVEIVNCRLTAVGTVDKFTSRPGVGVSLAEAMRNRRQVYFGGEFGWCDTAVYTRGKLPPHAIVEGPAIIEEMSSTTIVLPDQQAKVDDFGNIQITFR